MTKTERTESNLKIGSLKLDNPFILAPMAGITDASMRRICRQLGASLTYSEMVSAKGIYYNDKKTERLLFSYPEDKPWALQIFGHEPEIMAYAADYLEKYDNAILDINMGCPVPKVVKNGDGSALMNDPKLIEEVVKAVVKASSKPVTVKIRLGFSELSMNAVDCAKAIEQGGASMVAVHGRTRSQFYSGKANWEKIREVKESVSIPVCGNGDVNSVYDAATLMKVSGCDFVMIGRAIEGNPWIFRDLKNAWEGNALEDAPSIEEKKSMIRRQLEELCELKGEYAAIREMRRIASWYLKGMPGGAKKRAAFNQVTELSVMKEMIEMI